MLHKQLEAVQDKLAEAERRMEDLAAAVEGVSIQLRLTRVTHQAWLRTRSGGSPDAAHPREPTLSRR